jgi:hypothetical protein
MVYADDWSLGTFFTRRTISTISTINAADTTTTTHPLEDHTHYFSTADLTAATHRLAVTTEADIDPGQITVRRVGRTLGKMRLVPLQHGVGRPRGWCIRLTELQRWAARYSVYIFDTRA